MTLGTIPRTVLDRSRAARAGGPLAWLAGRLVPSGALSWGVLTVESPRWRRSMERCARRWLLRGWPDGSRAAFERLASTMGEPGKRTADAFVPAQFDGWWQP